jgi:hypothetical protein
MARKRFIIYLKYPDHSKKIISRRGAEAAETNRSQKAEAKKVSRKAAKGAKKIITS